MSVDVVTALLLLVVFLSTCRGPLKTLLRSALSPAFATRSNIILPLLFLVHATYTILAISHPQAMSLLTTQPYKALWVLGAIATTVIRLPFWLVYFLPSFLRQDPRWTYAQAIRVRLLRIFLHHASIVEMDTLLPLTPGDEKNRFVVTNPAATSRYTGPCNSLPAVKPLKLGGTWYPAPPPPPAETAAYDTVVLHFHGGAYVTNTGRSGDGGFTAATLLKHTPATRVFMPQYRLANHANCAFPAQLQDAITSLSYLLDTCQIPAERIILSGDSAGGHLVGSLLRYLADHAGAAQLPSAFKAAWLWSPWVDPGNAVAANPAANAMLSSPNYPRDYLTPYFGAWGAKALGSLSSPYVKLVGNAFATETPIYVSTGECEVLFHDDVKWADEMRAVKGNRLELSVEEKAVHDIIIVGGLAGFEKEAERAARRAGEWLEGL